MNQPPDHFTNTTPFLPTLHNHYLHVDLVVLPKHQVAPSKGSQEGEDWVVSPCKSSEQQGHHLVDCGEEGKIASMLKGGLDDELELLLQTIELHGKVTGIQRVHWGRRGGDRGSVPLPSPTPIKFGDFIPGGQALCPSFLQNFFYL